MKQTRDLGMNHEHLPWLVLAGVASPIILFVASMAVAAGRPEYSHLRQTFSELGTRGRPGAIWMNWLGIVPAGFLIPVCAPSLYRAFGRGRRSATGSILLGAGGACLGGSGLTPWQGGLPPDFSIPGNVLHLSLALTGFLLLALAPLFFALQARSARGLSQWSRFSFGASALIFVLAFAPPGVYPGALQRGALVVFYAWLCAVSVWVWRSRGGSSSLSPENNPRSAASTASKSAVQQMSAIWLRRREEQQRCGSHRQAPAHWLWQFRHDRKTKSVDQTSSKN